MTSWKILISLLALGCLVTPPRAAAQGIAGGTTGVGDSLDAFRAPTSPAFVLLGIEPTSVERPTTPRAVAVSLLSSGLADGVIPNNYAIEFSPYWLTPHPELTYENYVHASLAEQVVQSFSLSIVAAKSTVSSDSGSDLGAGFRFHLGTGEKSAKLSELEDSLRSAQTEKLNAFIDHPGDTVLQKRLDAKMKRLGLEMQNEFRNRKGLVLEIAGALAGHFPQNDMNRGELVHGGVWATLSYRPESTALEFLGVGRLIWNNSVGGDGNYFDVGGRLLWQNGTLLLSGEFVERTTFNTVVQPNAASSTVGVITFSNTYRASLLAEYRISKDTALQYSFGHNFTQVGGVNNLISQLGVKLGFGG